MRRRVTHAEATRLRTQPGATAVLFLTDRCPVGCGHCSVSSRVDSPTITDWPLFGELVAGLCALTELEAVAVTGGEPFTERRGLIYAVEALHDAGKAVVVFTSGHWARAAVPAWIAQLLTRVSTVYLSTDSFHHAGVAPGGVESAARAVEEAGCQLVLQVLDEPEALGRARELSATADISVIAPISVGRGEARFGAPRQRGIDEFGRCSLLNSPTIRYDGHVLACCQEKVIMGRGPDGLRRKVTQAPEVGQALAGFRSDPVLRLMSTHGPAALRPVLDGPFQTVCEPCWAAQELVKHDRKARALIGVLAGAT